MKFNDVRKMAKDMNLNTYRMKKKDVIRAIQRLEGNPECYGTPTVAFCNEDSCLWRSDCLALAHQ
jgi:hypothetical protein